MKRIAGGIAGWIAAVVPLIGVNIAGYNNLIYGDAVVLAGAAALLGGILLGALVAGLLAGRPQPTSAGGASATLPAALTAGILYAISLIAVIVAAIETNTAPALVVSHYLRVSVAIVCLGAILAGMALVVGFLAGNWMPAPRATGAPQTTQPQRSTQYTQQPPMRQPMNPVPSAPYRGQPQPSRPNVASQPMRGAYPHEEYREPAGQRDQRSYRSYDSRSGQQGNEQYGYREDYRDSRQPVRYPPAQPPYQSDRDERNDRNSSRAGEWRNDWR